MNTEHLQGLDQRMQFALSELADLIQTHFPTATFTVTPGEDDAESIHLTTIVDVDDPDEVVDIVIDRVLQLQEAGLPVHVIPLRSLERLRHVLQAQGQRRPQATLVP